jgi:hypothetical protein
LGQPQFRPILASRDAEQLRQRVLASFHLGPLSADETRLYIEHRLKTVGWTGVPSWDDAAFAEIHRHTGGIPRRVNTLCSRVLQFGALDESTNITAEMVDEVATEMAEGLIGGTPVPINGTAAHETVGYPPPEINGAHANGVMTNETGELLRRIEVLEETFQRQDRVFQKMIRLLTSVVEKGA